MELAQHGNGYPRSTPAEPERTTMSVAAQNSLELFNSGFWCAESVLLAMAQAQGIQSDLLPRIATGFCSGMARTGGQCGAVSGAMLALGLANGRRLPTDSVDANYAAIQELMRRFEERFGSLNCRELLGVDFRTSEGQQTFRDRHLIERCKEYVHGAAEIGSSLLED